ncbi:ankyrin [Linderina pennispora]|uniref:protein S-acyltransferase n=1 Tax=Linderina pennispora TaxID=61395 RepID=A0A1Y1W2N1_9FUNG|nr:ankyrin [Linderina pennispora]ORX67526.1 ankyrin [Linderina pennispora]
MEVDQEYAQPTPALAASSTSSTPTAEITTTVTPASGAPNVTVTTRLQTAPQPQTASAVSPSGLAMAMHNAHMSALTETAYGGPAAAPFFQDNPHQVHSFMTDTHGVSHYHRPSSIHRNIAHARWTQQMAMQQMEVQREMHMMHHQNLQAIQQAPQHNMEAQHRAAQSMEIQQMAIQQMELQREMNKLHHRNLQAIRRASRQHMEAQHRAAQQVARRLANARLPHIQNGEPSINSDVSRMLMAPLFDMHRRPFATPERFRVRHMQRVEMLQAMHQRPRQHRPNREQGKKGPIIEEINSGQTSRIESEVEEEKEAEDEDEWVSDGDDVLSQETKEMIERIRRRAADRRRVFRGGISKPTASTRSQRLRNAAGASGKTREELSKAYRQFMRDGANGQELVTQMGSGDTYAVQQMLDAGIPVDIADNMGRTPLHIACSHGNADTVRLLISRGASVNATDRIGNTPLALAATSTGTESVIALLEAGADPRIGSGTVSAMGMVRSRLKRMRAAIRETRVVEDAVDSQLLERALAAARDRRKQATMVAREEEKPPKALTNEGLSDLDDLTAQLQSLGMAEQPNEPEAEEEAMPDIVGVAVHRVAKNTYAGKIAQEKQEEEQMDALLEKFSLLLTNAGANGDE